MTDKSSRGFASQPRLGAARKLLNAGVKHRQQGQLSEAISCFRKAIAVEPKIPKGYLHLAETLEIAGQPSEAAAHYQKALALDPNSQLWCQLGNLCERHGQFQQAMDSYLQAIAMHSDCIPARCAIGTLLHRLGQIPQAILYYRQVLALDPKNTQIQLQLGNAYQHQGQLDLATDSYRQVLELDPDNVDAYTNLGLVYRIADRREEAAACYLQALERDPQSIQAMANLGFLRESQGQLDEAEDWFRHTLSIRPNHQDGIAGLATVHEKRGDYGAAYALLKPQMQAPLPSIGIVLHFATACLRLGCAEEALPLICRGLERQEIAINERSLLLFKLGDLNDSLARFDEAFEAYRMGNSLNAPAFQADAWVAGVDRMLAGFDRQVLEHLPAASLYSKLPVFVVGMPRSGTSLVEQILASHPEVHGAGELQDLFKFAASLPKGGLDAEELATLDPSWLTEAAENYLMRLQARAPGAKRITDKLPTNFLNLVLITLAFPGARVIHCQRDPLDTCLSCYFQNFGARHAYTSSLEHLGIFYSQYERLMEHWQRILDLPIFEVRYEALVADTETVSRELIAFLGLDWDSRCLEFHRTERFVNTSSYDQVRRPIYNRSVGRAMRDYGKHLEPLIKMLKQV
jgi:tetratricopeptide (TPR) repeat protein